jgi:hypothetical protein
MVIKFAELLSMLSVLLEKIQRHRGMCVGVPKLVIQ